MALSEFAKPYYSPEELAKTLRDAGYKAEMERLQSGRWTIRSSTGGYSFSIYLYGPKDQPDQVHTLQFTTSFAKPVTVDQVNKWNREKRFTKAYADSDGDLTLEWDVVVKFVAPAYIKECIEWWELTLGGIGDM